MNAMKIRCWALYSHVYFFFESGGTLAQATERWGAKTEVFYLYAVYLSAKGR